MVRILTFIMIITFQTSLFGNTPTLESMLRHGSNTDLEGKLINAKFIVTKTAAGEIEAGQNSSIAFSPFAYQWVGLIGSSKDLLMYLRYASTNHDSKELVQMSSGTETSFKKLFVKSVPAGIFFASLTSLLLNRGDIFIEFLQSQGIDVKLNKNLINLQKLALLKSYKEYLIKKKEDSNEGLVSPLSPETAEEKERVNEILKQSFYNAQADFKLVKLGNNFSWIFEKDNIFIEFNFEHQLKRVEIKTADGTYGMFFENYNENPGGAIFPKTATFKMPNGEIYEIQTKNITVYKSNEDAFARKVRYFKERFNTSSVVPSPVLFLGI